MKKKLLLVSLFFLSLSMFADKFVWNVKTGYPGVGRHRSSGIGIGNKVYYGLGHVSSGAVNVGYQDWWEFDPATNAWTQKANYAHQSHGAVGFTIGNKGYIVGGSTSKNSGTLKYAYFRDTWEYNPQTNIWTQRNNFLGGDTLFVNPDS